MTNAKVLYPILILANVVLIDPTLAGKKTDTWKYAGEDHGIRFFFKAKKSCQEGPISLKVENTLSIPVEVSFRVKDIDWKKEFAQALAPNETDSSLVYKPMDGSSVCHPYFDRVFMENSAQMTERAITMAGQ